MAGVIPHVTGENTGHKGGWPELKQLPEWYRWNLNPGSWSHSSIGAVTPQWAGHGGSILHQILKVTYKNTPKAKDGKDGRGRFTKVWEHPMEEGAFQLGLDRLLRWTEMEEGWARAIKENKTKPLPSI